MSDNLNFRLLKTLECPICYNYMNSKIYVCSNGHSYCDTCYSRLKRCAACSIPNVARIRNYLLEDVAKTLLYPCENKSFGCKQMCLVNDLEKHAQICCYRIYNCMIDGCKWNGRIFDMEKHFSLKHKNSILYGSENVFEFNVNSASNIKEMIIINDKKFILSTYSTISLLYFIVQYLGESEDTKQFHYEVEINSSQPENYARKIHVSEPVFNDLIIDLNEIVGQGYGIAVSKNVLQTYTNESDVITYKVSIKSSIKSN